MAICAGSQFQLNRSMQFSRGSLCLNKKHTGIFCRKGECRLNTKSLPRNSSAIPAKASQESDSSSMFRLRTGIADTRKSRRWCVAPGKSLATHEKQPTRSTRDCRETRRSSSTGSWRKSSLPDMMPPSTLHGCKSSREWLLHFGIRVTVFR